MSSAELTPSQLLETSRGLEAPPGSGTVVARAGRGAGGALRSVLDLSSGMSALILAAGAALSREGAAGAQEGPEPRGWTFSTTIP